MFGSHRSVRVIRKAEGVLVALACAAAFGGCIVVLRVVDSLPAAAFAWTGYVIVLSVLAIFALPFRSPVREHMLWAIGGLVLGFTILGGFSIGPAFLPAAGLLLLAALIGDFASPRWIALHLLLAFVSCVLQVTVPLFVLPRL